MLTAIQKSNPRSYDSKNHPFLSFIHSSTHSFTQQILSNYYAGPDGDATVNEAQTKLTPVLTWYQTIICSKTLNKLFHLPKPLGMASVKWRQCLHGMMHNASHSRMVEITTTKTHYRGLSRECFLFEYKRGPSRLTRPQVDPISQPQKAPDYANLGNSARAQALRWPNSTPPHRRQTPAPF